MDEKLTRDRLTLASKKLRHMREKRILTDVMLKCRGGNIYAHKCVLMATNTFFYKLFSKDLQGDTQIELEFKDVPLQVMSVIVTTLYGGVPQEIKGDIAQIIKVLETSHLIHEKLLFKYCIHLLMDRLVVSNCIALWNLTIRFELEKEECRVMEFILDHIAEVINENKMADISLDQMNDFVTYASGIVDTGDQLALVVTSWGKKNPKERTGKVIALFGILGKLQFSNDSVLRTELETYLHGVAPPCETVRPFVSRLAFQVPLTQVYPPTASSSSVIMTSENHFTPITRAFSPPTHINSIERFTVDIPSSASVFVPVVSSCGLNCKQKLAFQINFFCMSKGLLQSYSMIDSCWAGVKQLALPGVVPHIAFPLITPNGNRLYFYISDEDKFTVYSEYAGDTHVGPSVTLRNQVSGACDGKFVYVWNFETIVQFNSESKTWKCLSPNLNIVAGCSTLLVCSGELFIHSELPPTLYKYDFAVDEWKLQKAFTENYAVKCIKTKCYRCGCKKKLYFYTNEKHLLQYDVVRDEWSVLLVLEFENAVPLVTTCDDSFIVFGDKSRIFSFHIETKRLLYLGNYGLKYENVNLVCDLSVM